jgi:N6-adenosine-specific RNA methylase IME4
VTDPFPDLPRGHYGAIYADPPWHFNTWAEFKPLASGGNTRAVQRYYGTMKPDELMGLPVSSLAADDSCLFMWICWPNLLESLDLIKAWGFEYKTCAFAWMKAHAKQIDMFRDDIDVQVGLGYWTRANSEVCLLATRGKPKRLNADVRQGIIAPRREHSRKPDGVHERIERLVAGPYLELFARQKRAGWDVWGNQTDKFKAVV